MPIIKPFVASRKYYATAEDGTVAGGNLTIPATAFLLEGTGAVTAFPGGYAYYTIELSGTLQTSDVSTLTTTDLTVVGGASLDPQVPIVVELIVN